MAQLTFTQKKSHLFKVLNGLVNQGYPSNSTIRSWGYNRVAGNALKDASDLASGIINVRDVMDKSKDLSDLWNRMIEYLRDEMHYNKDLIINEKLNLSLLRGEVLENMRNSNRSQAIDLEYQAWETVMTYFWVDHSKVR
jgi:hypothetical protein